MKPTDTTTDVATDSEASQPTYAYLDPSCPVCGTTSFSSTEEDIPYGLDTHQVHTTCANCKTPFTIEYRAIDIFWYGSHDEQHSAVSQDILIPMQTEYVEAAMYAPLPDSTVLEELDWPCHCDELLTGNDLVADPHDFASDDDEDAEPPQVLFQCPICDHRSTGTAAESA